ALLQFLQAIGQRWNISLFHYRNHGSDYGRVLAGVQVPPAGRALFAEHLATLGYEHHDGTDSPAYRLFLGPTASRRRRRVGAAVQPRLRLRAGVAAVAAGQPLLHGWRRPGRPSIRRASTVCPPWLAGLDVLDLRGLRQPVEVAKLADELLALDAVAEPREQLPAILARVAVRAAIALELAGRELLVERRHVEQPMVQPLRQPFALSREQRGGCDELVDLG